jgi:hypothetical protein
MAAARGIRMRELVDQNQRGASGQRAVEIELRQHAVPIRNLAQRQALESIEQRLGLGAAMRLDHADHHVHALLTQRARGAQHGKGLAHAGRRAKVDAQFAASGTRALRLHALQQGVGIGRASGSVIGIGGWWR